MVFYINACHPSISLNDSMVNMYQMLMFSILVAYMLLILTFRVGSALKNHDLHSIQAQSKRTVIPV